MGETSFQTITVSRTPAGPSAFGDLVTISLNRPDKANAFSEQMMSELTAAFSSLSNQDTRLLILRSTGKHFSAGADLEWMAAAGQKSREENLQEAGKLTKMFEALVGLPCPTLAMVKGAAFGGGVGLVAACDMALASPDAQFSLSEVRLGILPAVILPYLGRKMLRGHLNRYALSGEVFSGVDAHQAGLVQWTAPEAEWDKFLQDWLGQMRKASPEAQRSCKDLLARLAADSFRQSEVTRQAIADARASEQGKVGLQSFFNKEATPWSLPKEKTN